jgi:eukaryotic-like serine/threonine-protein kinase
MEAERWNQVQTLFKEIVALDEKTRETRLQEVSATDPGIVEEIRALLEADADKTSILDSFAIDTVDISSLFSMEGTQIGAFNIINEIGSGGMGNVYLARRVEGGFDQTVALKLIKFGMGSDKAIRRFESERSILARLQHPNIARLVDGGLTGENHPWFAMEFAEGETLISYCRRLDLSVEKRLQLFLNIIEAVQYAHRNRVVHCDLKPGNILVTGDDDKPQIKLLDFGIAQIMEESEGESSEIKAMTRAYASPEQISGDSTSTATDIYSLGVVLYQLLTECHPDPEFRRDDCKPAVISAELEAICSKAMETDPELRFENASEMGDELKAWLDERPVSCYSVKPLYRLRKRMNRNRAASFIAVFAIISLIITVFLYTFELKKETERAQNEATRAARIAEVLGSSLRSIDPMQNGGQELTARRMVDMSTGYINNQLAGDSRTKSELLIMMAGIYANLNAFEVADSVSQTAEELMINVQDTTSFAYIDLLAKRSVILDQAGKYDEAMDMIQRALDLANRHLEPGSLDFASVHLDYTYHLDVNARYTEADSILMLVQPIYEENLEEAGETYADFIFYLGTNYRRTGDYENAEKYLFQSLEISRSIYPDIHEQIASTLNHISSLYQNMGNYEEAISYAKESHAMRVKIFGPGHLNTIAAHSNTARAQSGAGKLADAAETYHDVLAIFRDEFGNDNFYIAGILQSYAGVYLRMEEYEQAEIIIRESLEHSERLLPPGHIRQAYPLKGLADALRGQKRFSEALPYAEKAYHIRNESLEDDDPNLMTARYTLGLCLWNLNRRDEAETHLRESLAFFETNSARFQSQIKELRSIGF